MTALAIERLRIALAGGAAIVDDVTCMLEPGEVVAVVGESGSGKTTLGLAALGHLGAGITLDEGTVCVGDASLFALAQPELERVRGARISYVAQHPASALNPALTVGSQLRSMLAAHGYAGAPLLARIDDVLDAVSVPTSPELLGRYPHQLSGGQQRRVALAIALACDPDVIVLDEPTSGLDTATGALVLDTIRRLCRDRSMAVLCITHDLTVVADLADRVAVMYAGSIVEEGRAADVLAAPAHPYTRHLLAAAPDPDGVRSMIGLAGRAPSPGRRPDGCRFAPRCGLVHDECTRSWPALVTVADARRARCVIPFGVPVALERPGAVAARPAAAKPPMLRLEALSASYRGVATVHDVTIDVAPGEWLALVGRSGAGKTTLIRSIAGLHREVTGRVELDGVPMSRSVRSRTQSQRRAIQIVFQDPYGSFNPRRTIGESVARPAVIGGTTRARGRDDACAMLERVGLDARLSHRYPDELSGGELQRAAIARALVPAPRLLLCDEITSSLDVIVQASIVNLLAELRAELDLAVVFVTHDLALVKAVADRTAVMADGRIVGGI